jgi:hypothetical protein
MTIPFSHSGGLYFEFLPEDRAHLTRVFIVFFIPSRKIMDSALKKNTLSSFNVTCIRKAPGWILFVAQFPYFEKIKVGL